MKNILIFLGKNTIPTIIISIITLAVFSTSVYGFVKVASSHSPIRDIPDVETVGQKETESATPTPSLGPKEIENEDDTESLDPSASPTPLLSPTIVRNRDSDDHSQAEVRTGDRSRIRVDNDTEDVHIDSDRNHSEPRQTEIHDK